MNYSYNPYNYDKADIRNRKDIFGRLINRIFNFGMKYDDMVIKNQMGIGIYEDPVSSRWTDFYSIFSKRAISSVLEKKSIPYLDRTYSDKKRILREYSVKSEISNFIDIITNEAIIYDDDERYFCHPKPLSNEYPQEVRDKYLENFEKIYNRYGFSDCKRAWNLMRDFLIDGYIAMEIVYDDKGKNIIGFNRLKPETLVPSYEPNIGHLWIQYPDDPYLRRIFLDSEIIFISYSSQNDFSELSYVERLIRPYNQLKIVEQTRIIFNVVNASIYQSFTVPVKGLSRMQAQEQISKLIHDYHEHVEWDDSTGVLTINGSKNLPYNKQFWFPEDEHGSVKMEMIAPEGHNLNESDMLNWFYNALKRASLIPFQRLDKDNGGGTIFNEASEMTRDEIIFSNYIRRLRVDYKEIIVKPLKIQMLKDFPEYKDDEFFLNQIDISFNSNQLFEEWKKLSNLEKRINIANSMLNFTKNDKPYFHIDFIIDHIIKLTPQEKDENTRYWLKDKDIGGGFGESEDMTGDTGFETGGEGGTESPTETETTETGVGETGEETNIEGSSGEEMGGEETNTEFEF